jgi:hypothetical protein
MAPDIFGLRTAVEFSLSLAKNGNEIAEILGLPRDEFTR